MAKEMDKFFIINEPACSMELRNEVNYYNSLIDNFKHKSHEIIAIKRSELMIREFAKKCGAVYPVDFFIANQSLVQLISTKPIDIKQFKKAMTNLKKQLSPESYQTLSLFIPFEQLYVNEEPYLGWDFSDLYGSTCNIFMFSVQKGAIEVVDYMLSEADEETQEKMLHQALQYFDKSHELLFKPILDLAIDSENPDMFPYLINLLAKKGMLKEACSQYSSLKSQFREPTNLLNEVIKRGTHDQLTLILNHADDMGRVFYMFAPDKAPVYCTNKGTIVPVIQTAVLYNNADFFNLILTENLKAIDAMQGAYDQSHPFTIQYKIALKVDLLTSINLEKYIESPNFNPAIFSRIIDEKLKLSREIDDFDYKQKRWEWENSIPIPHVDGKPIQSVRFKSQLWLNDDELPLQKSDKWERLESINTLFHYFEFSRKKHSYQAMSILLIFIFNSLKDHTRLKSTINKLDSVLRSVMLNR